MRVLVALDKFKEALAAPAACAAVAAGLRAAHPDWTLDLCPLADGGDGFVAALTADGRGETRATTVAGPLGQPVSAAWALVPPAAIPRAALDRLGFAGPAPLAVIEMAACSGLALVPRDRRAPWQSSSHGVGQLLLAAAHAGAGALLLGVGGSATNDLGLGALHALGWRALDGAGRPVDPPTPGRWAEIVRLAPPPPATPRLPPIHIACDVANPLLGPRGATFAYGPQKGLAPAELPLLDAAMARTAALLAAATGSSPALFDTPGAGAAGGVAAGLMAAAGARLVGGFDLVADWLDLRRRLARADLVITGEGAFDDSSLAGKGPGGLARAALAAGKRTVVFAGRIQMREPPPGLVLRPITPPGLPLAEALPATARLLEASAARLPYAAGLP